MPFEPKEEQDTNEALEPGSTYDGGASEKARRADAGTEEMRRHIENEEDISALGPMGLRRKFA
jgi:hypothetical protein